MIKRILVPLDGSKMAESVLPVAVAIARCTSACITLLHIIEERPPRNVHGEAHLGSIAESQNYLAQLSERLTSRCAIELHVHESEEHDVALSVAAHSQELEADLIVLSTHGRSGPKRVVWGSIAQQVLKKVATPVLLVRPDMIVPAEISALLIALDGSQGAEKAISIAAELSLACHVTLEVARVVPTFSTLAGDQAAVARLVPSATEAALNLEASQSSDYMATILERLTEMKVSAKPRILRGDPVQMLAEEAHSMNASVIVLATHGRSGLGALLSTSVGMGLISVSERPLLLVRIPDGQ